MSVIFETQKAVYAKLTADSTLMALVHGVYDFVQEEVEYPYVTIGDISASDNSVLGVKGFKLAMNINVYNQVQGKSETLDIIDRIKFLLDGMVLTIIGFSHVYTKLEALSTARSTDNVVLSGKMQFSILVRVA